MSNIEDFKKGTRVEIWDPSAFLNGQGHWQGSMVYGTVLEVSPTEIHVKWDPTDYWELEVCKHPHSEVEDGVLRVKGTRSKAAKARRIKYLRDKFEKLTSDEDRWQFVIDNQTNLQMPPVHIGIDGVSLTFEIPDPNSEFPELFRYEWTLESPHIFSLLRVLKIKHTVE